MDIKFGCACVALTAECNLDCKFCYRPAAKRSYLDPKRFDPLLKKLKELGCHAVNITGGEPLLHPDCGAFIRKAAAMGFEVILSTNAILFDPDDPVYENVNLVVIPLDGSNAEVNDQVRGAGHFACAKRILDQYRTGNYPYRIKINTVMTVYNYDDLLNMAQELRDAPFLWRIFYCKEKGAYNRIEKNELIDASRFIDRIDEIDRLFPDVLMTDACRRDVNEDLVHLMVTTDCDLVISDGEKNVPIGNLFTQSSGQLIEIAAEKGYRRIAAEDVDIPRDVWRKAEESAGDTLRKQSAIIDYFTAIS